MDILSRRLDECFAVEEELDASRTRGIGADSALTNGELGLAAPHGGLWKTEYMIKGPCEPDGVDEEERQ